jgi:hypothetical protein
VLSRETGREEVGQGPYLMQRIVISAPIVDTIVDLTERTVW